VASERVVILVENLSVPRDRRVWQECLSLRRAGYEVAVICPKGSDRDTESSERIEGVDIHRFDLTPASGGVVGYLREYGLALWRTRRLLKRITRSRPVDILHACNPPDLFFLLARPLRRRGTRFVFDHHDLVPELYLSRFERGPDLFYRATLMLERKTFGLADVVISTNESYRQIAIERGGKDPADVFVVRNAPDLERLAPGAAEPGLKHGRPHLLAYLGVMGPQDGVDHALRALAALKERRSDWHAVFMGDGDVLSAMKRLTGELGLQEAVTFTGLVGDAEIVRVLSTADVCLAPDPKNPLNDASTMMKIAEYMAFARPVVSFDLSESRFTAQEAALYAPANDERAFADRISTLLDDPDRRARMGALGRQRVEEALSWERSEAALLAAYARARG
jgi:glycosyltransferase involved in cell wall biosynthesis